VGRPRDRRIADGAHASASGGGGARPGSRGHWSRNCAPVVKRVLYHVEHVPIKLDVGAAALEFDCWPKGSPEVGEGRVGIRDGGQFCARRCRELPDLRLHIARLFIHALR